MIVNSALIAWMHSFERGVGVKDLPRSGDLVVLDAHPAFKHSAIRAIKAVPRSRQLLQGHPS
jgi:hypothetical protein